MGGSKEKEKEMKEKCENKRESKKTALASLSDSDDDIPPAVNAPVSDSDSGPDEVKKPKKEYKEKSGRPRSGDESDEHQSKKLKGSRYGREVEAEAPRQGRKEEGKSGRRNER